MTAPTSPLRQRRKAAPVAADPAVVPHATRPLDAAALPAAARRAYRRLHAEVGEERALAFVFAFRAATELHRAWNLSLLTSKVLGRVRDACDVPLTWSLGVFKLKVGAEADNCDVELRDDVRYDYDSEFQDLHYGIAQALAAGRVDVRAALRYQDAIDRQEKTAACGRSLIRNYPGRVLWYPFEAAGCAVIFFGGTWRDAGIAGVTGLAAGLIDYGLQTIGGRAGTFLDMLVGVSTGVIGGLWYTHVGPCCLSSFFLGTLYWFFYGTAFVVGVLEVIAGELEIGVTRFVGVSVKTFLLSLGAGVGLMMSAWGGAAEIWFESEEQHCDANFVKGQWFRLPAYVFCSIAVLGQYHLPLDRHWLALCVMVAAYEAQYSVFHGVGEYFTTDHLDTAASNIAGGAAGTIVAHILCGIFDATTRRYSRCILHGREGASTLDDLAYRWMRLHVRLNAALGIGRDSDYRKLGLEQRLAEQRRELQDPSHTRSKITLSPEDEDLVVETVVGTMDTNVWSVLMPAVYQLVPGSIIARLWFHSVFPPPPGHHSDSGSVFSNLMVISTSLALGLMFGLAACLFCRACWRHMFGAYPETGVKRNEGWMERCETNSDRSLGTDPLMDSVALAPPKIPQDAMEECIPLSPAENGVGDAALKGHMRGSTAPATHEFIRLPWLRRVKSEVGMDSPHSPSLPLGGETQ